MPLDWLERGEVRVRSLGFRAAQSLACCFRAGARRVVKWVGVCKNVEPTGSGTSSDNGKGGELDTAEPEEIAQDECLGNKAEKGVVKINSQGSIKPLKLVQIVVTVFVPAFNDTFLAASACKTLSPSPGKGERTKYQTILVG
ncbi:unnamed protein product [Vicia faba]|uniref:Uncharacterized protein n=1 Tax=Vicia faba TaxID=3906 RepID=A0AAV0Z1F9_VICFA|nr:unnamed protein product [Vicia faba]